MRCACTRLSTYITAASISTPEVSSSISSTTKDTPVSNKISRRRPPRSSTPLNPAPAPDDIALSAHNRTPMRPAGRASPIRSAKCGVRNQEPKGCYHSELHTPHFFQGPAEGRGFWGVTRRVSDSRLSLSSQPADRAELFGPASVYRLMDADERTIPAQPSDHRVGPK